MSTQSAECLVCSHDKDVPKLYSSFNNMDPGPIPLQLKVRILVRVCIYSIFYTSENDANFHYCRV